MKIDGPALAMGISFALMWSSAFATARIIVAQAPPLMALSLRFLIAGLIAVAIARLMGQSWSLTPGQRRSVIVFGLCQNALYLGLNFVAMQWIEASLAAIIAASMPLIVALLGWILAGDRVPRLGILGLAAGMLGVGLIMGTRISGGADPMAVGLCVLGALALAVATRTVRSASAGGNLVMIVGLQMLVGAAALGGVSAFFETATVIWTPSLILAFAYQILVPGLAATLIWFALVGRIGPVRASTFHFLNPFFGVTVAALLLGERIGALDIIGVAVAAAGILAVQIARLQTD